MGRGDPSAWVGRFRSFDRLILERVVAVWPRCRTLLPPQPHEDTITINLVDLLQRDSRIRSRFHWIEFQYEPFGHVWEGAAYSKGRIDMAVLLTQDRDKYLAYECKRLSVAHRDGGRRTEATAYVMQGLLKFTVGQYAENLPVGCMLGYVLDGDLEYAASRVREKIVECGQDVALVAGPRDEVAIGAATRFSSRHLRRPAGDEIEIRHALLPF